MPNNVALNPEITAPGREVTAASACTLSHAIVFSTTAAPLEHSPVPADQVREGSPTTATWEAPLEYAFCGL